MMLQQQTYMVGFRTGNAVQDLAGAVDPVVAVVEVGAAAEAASQAVMMNMVAVGEASGLAVMIGQDLLEVEAFLMIGQDLLEVEAFLMIGQDLLEVEAFLMIGQGAEDLVVHSLLAEEEIGNHQLFWNDLKLDWGFRSSGMFFSTSGVELV
jgi:hypothetical protein